MPPAGIAGEEVGNEMKKGCVHEQVYNVGNTEYMSQMTGSIYLISCGDLCQVPALEGGKGWLQGHSGIQDSNPLNHGSDSPCQLSHMLLYYFKCYLSYAKNFE